MDLIQLSATEFKEVKEKVSDLGGGKYIQVVHPCEMLGYKLHAGVIKMDVLLAELKFDVETVPSDVLNYLTLRELKKQVVVISWADRIRPTCALISNRKQLTTRYRTYTGAGTMSPVVLETKKELTDYCKLMSIPTFQSLDDCVAYSVKQPAISYESVGLTQKLPDVDARFDFTMGVSSCTLNGILLQPDEDRSLAYLQYDAGLLDMWMYPGPNNFEMVIVTPKPVPTKHKQFFASRNISFFPLFKSPAAKEEPEMRPRMVDDTWTELHIMSVRGNSSRTKHLVNQLATQGILSYIIHEEKKGIEILPFGDEAAHAKSDPEKWRVIEKMNAALKLQGVLSMAAPLLPYEYIGHALSFRSILENCLKKMVLTGVQDGVMLYLEDDASLTNGFRSQLNSVMQSAPPDWDVILLGVDEYLYNRYGGTYKHTHKQFNVPTGTTATKLPTGFITQFPVGAVIGMYGALIHQRAMAKIIRSLEPMSYAVDVTLGVLSHNNIIHLYTLANPLVMEDKSPAAMPCEVIELQLDPSWNNMRIYSKSRFVGSVCVVGNLEPRSLLLLDNVVPHFDDLVTAMLWRVCAEHVTDRVLRDSLYESD